MGGKAKLIEDALRLTSKAVEDTPAFRQWFGDFDHPQAYSSRRPTEVVPPSQVTRDGRPMVVYHGTGADIQQFDPSVKGTNSNLFGSWEAQRAGHFFAENPTFADEFSTQGGRREGANTVPAYLNIKNPIDLSEGFPNAAFDAIRAHGLNERYYNNTGPHQVWETFDHENGGDEFVRALQNAGYDGAYTREIDANGDEQNVWVAFDPKQIKSSISNSTFDPNDPRIHKGGGGSLIDDALALTAKAIDSGDVNAAASGVPEFLRKGYKVEAHPSAGRDTRSLVDYLNQSRSNLPMDEAARTERAGDMGYTYDAYHGAPRDIEGFDNRHSNDGGYWGGHHYATTSPLDASENYAHPLGADIAQRIGEVQENLLDGFHPNDVKEWFRDTYGRELTDDEAVMSQNVDAWTQSVAHDQLGITNQGAVYPVKMRMTNPVRIDGRDQTFWPVEVKYTDDGDIEEESGAAIDLLQGLRETLEEYGGPPPDDVVNEVAQHVYENGGVDPKTLRDIVMKSDGYYYNPDGNIASAGHILSDTFQKMGHDGIIMDTDVFAPSRFRRGMAGTGNDTQHYIVFDPKNIRSRFGAFDPAKADSKRLSDADGGRVERDGYATRGRVAAALKIATEGLDALAKRRGVAAREIGEPYGGVLPRTPFEEWRYEAEPHGDMIPRKDFDPEIYKPGDVVIPLIGDRTSAGKKITSIAGKKLDEPFVTEGGPDYMRGVAQQDDKSMWASDQGKVTRLNNRIDTALKASLEAGYNDPSAYGLYVSMGPTSGDFSTHTADAVFSMLPHSKILKKDITSFDRWMKSQDKNWPGIMSPKARDYVINADAGEHRKTFVEALDNAELLKRGFPDVALARYVTTTPDLVDAPAEAAGYAIGKFDLGNRAGSITAPHRTYSTTMPGEYVGSMPPGLMRDDVFTQFSKEYDAKSPGKSAVMPKRRSFDFSKNAYQIMHEADIQNMVDYLDKVKRGYAGGGEVNEDIGNALRVAKDKGGALRKAALKLLGKTEREGLMGLTEPGSGYAGVPGKPSKVNLPRIGEAEAKPIPQIMDAASSYMAKRGMQGGHQIDAYPELDIEMARRIAKAFERMKDAPDDPEVRRAYDALAQETMDQFEAAKDLGIDFRAIRGDDPYAASPSIGYADIAERGNLHFFPTDAGFGSSIEHDPSNNPLLKRVGKIGDLENATVNDAFRIVHDLYGHYGPGNPFFRGPGEERAYLLHRKMFGDDAVPALATETRGQNSWLNYGPHGEKNAKAKSADTTFADQKVGILPPWVYRDGRADGGRINDALRIAKEVGGSTAPVFLTDAQGRQYDAQGKLVQPSNGTTETSSSAAVDVPTAIDYTRRGVMEPGEPENYESEVEPFIDAATTQQNYAVPDPNSSTGTRQEDAPSLLEAMKIAGKLAASGQPTDDRAPMNWGRRREETVREVMGAPVDGTSSPYQGPFSYNPSGMAGYVNTLIDFSPYALAEVAHDIPYQAGVTGDYGTAAVEGGLNALLSAPGLAVAGAAGRAGIDFARKNPKMVAGLAAAGLGTLPSDAEAGPARWYSKLLETAQALPMEKMTGQQALAMLRKGVSPEELRWTGTDQLLASTPQISKGELLEHLKNNRVATNEIIRGGTKPTNRDDVITFDDEILQKYGPERDRLMNEFKAANARRNAATDNDEISRLMAEESQKYRDWFNFKDKMVDAQIEKMGGLGLPVKFGPGSKYGEKFYTPGGENYQETTFTIPPERKERELWPVLDVHGNVRANYDSKEAAERVARMSGSTIGEPKKTVVESGYRSSHWPELNTLGHIRTQILEANLPGANRPLKLFNVDESQSDYAQDARKYGVMGEGEEDAVKNINEYTAKMLESWIDKKASKAIAENPGLFSNNDEARAGFTRLANQRGATGIAEDLGVLDEFERLRVTGERARKMVKPAPYIGNTQQWTDLSIKKSLDKAIDSGADYFTFTPGEVHADRYNLARDLSHIEYEPDVGGAYTISAVDKSGKTVLEKDMDVDEIEEYFGKEIAKKIKADEGRKMEDRPLRDWRILDNEQIKTKGDAMVDAYNNIYKKRVEKVVKEAAGKKITWEVLPAETANGIVPRLGFRIDDDIKKARFSDFARGGVVTGKQIRDTSPAVSRALAITSEY
jgi:hypothetical protein